MPRLLVPEGLAADTWGKLSGIERFVLRMMDMETTGARKLDNYQNFAKAFRVQDYARVMASMAPNEARLKRVDLLAFVERKAPETDVRTAAEVLGARLKNQRSGA